MTDSLGTTTYSYDALNRLVRYTDPSGKVVGYEYDSNNNRTAIIYPDGKMVQYGYDALNRLTSVRDWFNRTTTYSYDSAGRLTGTVNPNGTFVTYSYDNAGRLTGLINRKSNNTIISSYSYRLDAVGNHLQSAQIEPLLPVMPDKDVSHTHDAENRMISAGGISHSFDNNGNLIGRGSGDSFSYDYRDKLIQSIIGERTTQYQYDGVGNRLSRAESGVTKRYVLDINSDLPNVLAETDGNGTITAYYVYGLGLISRVLSDGTASYYHYDSRGSTVALTDAGQNITDAYAYDPFGRVVNSTGSTQNPFRYVGRYGLMDEGNGLTYIRARYYMPEMGRFITKDLLTGEDRDSQSLNRYLYPENNPVRYVDVSGLQGERFDYLMTSAKLSLKLAKVGIWWQGKVVKAEKVATAIGNIIGTNTTLPSSLDPALQSLNSARELTKVGSAALTLYSLFRNINEELRLQNVTWQNLTTGDLSLLTAKDWEDAIICL